MLLFYLASFPNFALLFQEGHATWPRRHAQVPGALASDGPRRPHRRPCREADLPDIPGQLHLQRGRRVQLLQVPSTPPLLRSVSFTLSPSSPVMDETKLIDRDAPLVATIEQHVRAGAGRAHPLPAEAHVRLRHLRLCGEREDHPEQGQPAFRVRRARARQAIQGEGQGPRQVQVRCISLPNNARCLSLDSFCF